MAEKISLWSGCEQSREATTSLDSIYYNCNSSGIGKSLRFFEKKRREAAKIFASEKTPGQVRSCRCRSGGALVLPVPVRLVPEGGRGRGFGDSGPASAGGRGRGMKGGSKERGEEGGTRGREREVERTDFCVDQSQPMHRTDQSARSTRIIFAPNCLYRINHT